MSELTHPYALRQRYLYDAVDRLSVVQPSGELARRRFYSGSVPSNELAGTLKRTWLMVGDQLSGVREQENGPATLRLLCSEQQGSVLQVLDVDARQGLAYTPHGEGADRSLPGFNGEQPDSLTGHYLLGNGYRAYNPTLMRFHSPDNLSPFGGGGLSAYSYCLGDPINRTDPTGHLSWQAGLGIGLGVLGLAYGGYALASGALAASTGVSAVSAAVMVAGAAGIGAIGTGAAQAAVDPDSAAAGTLGWISLGLGAVSFVAGLTANHLSAVNKQKPPLAARMMGEGPQALRAVPVVPQPSFSILEVLDDPAMKIIVRYLRGSDLENLSLASSRMNRRVNEFVRPLFVDFSNPHYVQNAHAYRGFMRSVWQGQVFGMLPSQVARSPMLRAVTDIPAIGMQRFFPQALINERAAWQADMRAINAARVRPSYTHL